MLEGFISGGKNEVEKSEEKINFGVRVSGIFRKEKLWGSPQSYQISVSPYWRENSKQKNELCSFLYFRQNYPSAIKCWSYLFFHFWSFSFLNVVPVFFFCMGPFQCYVVWVSPFFFFFFFGCSSVSFLTRHQFWVFIFIYLLLLLLLF